MALIKRFTALVLGAACVMTLFSGCSQEQSPGEASGSETAGSGVFRVGYTNQADSDVWLKLVEDSFIQEMAGDKTVEVTCVEANNDQQKQLDQIDNFIMQKMDLIVVVACDYAGVTPGVQAANDAGIPIITLAIASEGGESTFLLLNAGGDFFWPVGLLFRGGIVQRLHRGVEFGNIVLIGDDIDKVALITLFLGDKIEDAVLFR